MNLSAHFTLEELTVSDTATRLSIDNRPSEAVIARLQVLCQYLERIREVIGAPIIITSGYRSPELCRAIKSSATSSHTAGEAADFKAPGFGRTTKESAIAIRDSGIPFDQLIYEGTWVHFGIREPMRKMVLTAHFGKGPVWYTAGIA